jgi:DNA-directed RNA polymerase subunit RPC12/RpoP
MSGMTDYKCPCCGGQIEFDSASQNMKCPFCDSEFSIEAVQEMQADQLSSNDMSWDTSAGTDWQPGETEGMKIYSCKSCGGEIVADELTGASSCPYCGNPVVISGTFDGDLRPDLVIPFKLDKNKAKEKLAEHLKGKKFLPKAFTDQNHIDEIKGVYVPFWLFDADADGDIRYEGVKERRWSDSNYRYVEKSYYNVRRTGSLAFEHVPVDGSSRMPDDLMESIEPFDYKDAVTFEKAYLSGYLADRYDVTAEQSIDRANHRIEESVIDTFRDSVIGYSQVTEKGNAIQLHNGKAQYVLYPVWILNTTWNDQKFLFAMNGQTGKFVGNLPLDKAAFLKAMALYSTVCAVIACIIAYFMGS